MLHETAVEVNGVCVVIISRDRVCKHSRIAIGIGNTNSGNTTQFSLTQGWHVPPRVNHKNAIWNSIVETLSLVTLDGICQSTANPTSTIDGEGTCFLGLFFNNSCLLRVARAQPKKCGIVLGHVIDSPKGETKKSRGLVEINDMHTVVITEDIRGHMRIPKLRSMAHVHAGVHEVLDGV